MAKFRVTKNPFKKDDFVEVEADGFMEDGSYTKFIAADGGVALAVPTQYVTKIEDVTEQ